MKKLFSIFAMLLLSVTLVACGDDDKKTTETETDTTPVAVEGSDFEDLADGLYFAAADEFANSYRYFVTLEVKDGVLIDATWDGYNIDMGASKIKGMSKYEGSMLGLYGMDAVPTNVNGKWYRQVERVIANLINTQQIDALTFDADGKTDEVAGISMHYSEFYDLVNDAIEAGPVVASDVYTDGFYYIASEPSSKGDVTMLTAVVLNGRLVLSDLNVALGTPKVDDADKKYYTKDSAGYLYGMEAATGAESDGEWFVQAARLEAFMLDTQGFDLNVLEDTTTDSVTGVSIKVPSYIGVWNMFDQQANSKYEYSGYADGYYFAAQEAFSGGYRYYVTLKVEDNRLVEAELNAYSQDGAVSKCGGLTKYDCSVAGTYGMDNAEGNVNGKWYLQADRIEKYAIDNQKLYVNYTNTSGDTDDIAGVSIHVSEFFGLAKTALEAGPIAEGDYVDGYYYYATTPGTKSKEFAMVLADGSDYIPTGETDNLVTMDWAPYTFGTFVVVNGTIVVADFNARENAYEYEVDANGKLVTLVTGQDAAGKDIKVNKIIYVENADGDMVIKKSYLTKDAAGDWYGMSQIGKVEWNDQVAVVEAKLLADQTLSADVDGDVDGVTSVSIHTDALLEVFNLIPTK